MDGRPLSCLPMSDPVIRITEQEQEAWLNDQWDLAILPSPLQLDEWCAAELDRRTRVARGDGLRNPSATHLAPDLPYHNPDHIRSTVIPSKKEVEMAIAIWWAKYGDLGSRYCHAVAKYLGKDPSRVRAMARKEWRPYIFKQPVKPGSMRAKAYKPTKDGNAWLGRHMKDLQEHLPKQEFTILSNWGSDAPPHLRRAPHLSAAPPRIQPISHPISEGEPDPFDGLEKGWNPSAPHLPARASVGDYFTTGSEKPQVTLQTFGMYWRLFDEPGEPFPDSWDMGTLVNRHGGGGAQVWTNQDHDGRRQVIIGSKEACLMVFVPARAGWDGRHLVLGAIEETMAEGDRLEKLLDMKRGSPRTLRYDLEVKDDVAAQMATDQVLKGHTALIHIKETGRTIEVDRSINGPKSAESVFHHWEDLENHLRGPQQGAMALRKVDDIEARMQAIESNSRRMVRALEGHEQVNLGTLEVLQNMTETLVTIRKGQEPPEP